MRAWLRPISHVVLGLIAATILTEIAFRIVEATPLWRVLPASEVAMYGPDPWTGYRHRANVHGVWLKEARAMVRTSSLGLRDRERSPERSGFRAVVLGDSIIEAVQVPQPDTAVAVAESLVAARHPGAEVVNLGLAGATPPVLVARLQSAGLALKPDLAVIVMSVGEFLGSGSSDDSAFTGYRENSDGRMALSYGFRETRGYRLRNATPGTMFYWLLDHSAVARVLNSRKNVGLLAEWPAPPSAAQAAPATGAACGADALREQTALWSEGKPEARGRIVAAFLRDLGAISRDHNLPIVLASRGIPVVCPQSPERDALMSAIDKRAGDAGVRAFDLDQAVAGKTGTPARLHGFGPTLGRGHLNREGNRIYGEILSDIVLTNMTFNRSAGHPR